MTIIELTFHTHTVLCKLARQCICPPLKSLCELNRSLHSLGILKELLHKGLKLDLRERNIPQVKLIQNSRIHVHVIIMHIYCHRMYNL